MWRGVWKGVCVSFIILSSIFYAPHLVVGAASVAKGNTARLDGLEGGQRERGTALEEVRKRRREEERKRGKG